MAIATMLVFLVVVPVTAGAGKASIALRSVGSVPASIAAGKRITLKGTVHNRSDSSRVGRVVVWLRKAPRSAGGRVVGRRTLRRLRGGRSARFQVNISIPRTFPAGRYSVIACVRTGQQKTSCKVAKRRLTVVAPTTKVTPPPGLPGPPALGSPEPLAPPAGTVFQTINGFGSLERGFGDSHVFYTSGPAPVTTVAQQDAVFDALYVDLGLTRVRPAQPDYEGVEPVNDNADPLSTNLAAFNFSGRAVDDHATYVTRAKSRGVKVAWNSPLVREQWMGVAPGTNDVGEYAEWLLAQVRRFSQRGARMDYISVANEPSYQLNNMGGAFIRDVIKSVAPRLQAEGLLVPFVISDDIRASASAASAAIVLADPVARGYVGALATHLYDEQLTRLTEMSSLALQYDLPLWMSEFSLRGMSSLLPAAPLTPTPLDWALLMHELLATYNVSAIDYLWGFFGGADADRTALVAINSDGITYNGFTRTKLYYYFGQYSRFVRPGAMRVALASSNGAIKASAYHDGRTRTIVAINPGSTTVVTTLSSPDLAGVGALTQTRTSSSENWASAPAVPVAGTTVSVMLPAESVATFTGTTG